MVGRTRALVALLALAARACLSLPNHQKVVYQQDDRQDVCTSSSELFKTIARESVAAIIDVAVLGSPDSHGEYTSSLSSFMPLGRRRNLCADQRFRTDPTAATCSSTLIAPDRVLTAGHCISSFTCSRRRFVFDYIQDGDDCAMPTITDDQVFRCVKFARVETNLVDFAVVFLDRAVAGRQWVQVEDRRLALAVGSRLTTIGFGSGIPAKIDDGGFVIDNRADSLDYFVASTDTFGGNSGSGVFDECGKLVGVLVRGQADYVTVGGCSKVNVLLCDDDQCSHRVDAEELTYPFRAIQAALDCQSDEECSGSEVCFRRCPVGSPLCTGWCMSASEAQHLAPVNPPEELVPSPFPASLFPAHCALPSPIVIPSSSPSPTLASPPPSPSLSASSTTSPSASPSPVSLSVSLSSSLSSSVSPSPASSSPSSTLSSSPSSTPSPSPSLAALPFLPTNVVVGVLVGLVLGVCSALLCSCARNRLGSRHHTRQRDEDEPKASRSTHARNRWISRVRPSVGPAPTVVELREE